MAIANADGSIVLSTRIDTSGLDKDMSKIEGKASKMTKTFSKLGAALAAAFAVKKIIQFSNEAANLAIQTEASVQRLVDIYGKASDAVGDFIDQNAKALGLSKSVGASIASTYGNLLSVWADQATNAELSNALLNQTAVVASKTGRTTEDVAERIRSGLLGNTEAIEDLGINVNIKTIEITDAFKRIADGRSWEQLNAYEQAQVRTLAILEQSTKKYGTQVTETSATIRNRYRAAYEDFKNSWGNIVNTVLLPVLKVLTQIFEIATIGLNVLSGRSRKILENAQKQEESTDNTAGNIETQTENQKKLNKEIKKTLAGFDDIQILSQNTAEATGGAGGLDSGTQGIGMDLGNYKPDGSAYKQEISATLAAIMAVVGVSLAALGCILLFSGQVAWGLGFLIAGAATFYITAATLGDDTISQKTRESISNALSITGIIAIVLGILLCMASRWEMGIGLIVIGATSLSLDVTLNWDIIKEALIEQQDKVTLAGGLMVALGIFMCVAGMWGLGIGAIIAGATLLVTEIVLNWDAIKQSIKEQSGKVALAGALLIAIGILMCLAGMFPLGIGAIVLGAGALIAVVALNWNAIVDKVKQYVFENRTLVSLISGGLLILGIILCATGVALPLGIALIAAGAAGLVTVVALNWNAIVNWVKGAWEAVKDFWNKHIAPVFTLKWWKDLAIACGNGLIAGFEAAINGIIWAFESMINWIVKGLNKISFEMPDWLPGWMGGGETFGINIKKANLGRISIPRLAQGAVIPANREFLAVLGDQKHGTNIEAPADLIKQKVMEAMVEMGGNFGGGNTEVILQIDGREFGRAVVEQGNKENRRIGTRLVIA